MQLLPCGPDAVLVELDDLGAVEAVRDDLTAALAEGALPGVIDVVPAARTVLVTGLLDGGQELSDRLVDRLRRGAHRDPTPPGTLPGVGSPGAGTSGADPHGAGTVELSVRYDGEDLAQVAEEAGMTPAQVVAAHTGAEHRVAFGGFAPGFAYLTGLPEVLHRARLATPRTRVPARSVGVAAEFTGVYPGESPGGWRLLGRVVDGPDAPAPRLFDPYRDPPALLRAGVRVRFREAR